MRPIEKNGRLTLLLENNVNQRLHLLAGNNERGMVSFACEQAPLLTFQSHGLPVRCPICGIENPFQS